MKDVPKQSTITSTLEPTQGGLNALTFKNQDEVLVTVLNESLESRSIQVSLRGGVGKLEVKHASIHFSPDIYPPEQGKKDVIETEDLELKLRSDKANDSYIFTLTLKPQSIFVGEFQQK